ncbi:hypothetical protein ABZU94_39570 [Streptomyces mirabilis]|uniref:hypothetical protein n=1 Tax=Streptomyces sp. NPDC005388 TaxID=3156717 RepID=UPI00339F64B8
MDLPSCADRMPARRAEGTVRFRLPEPRAPRPGLVPLLSDAHKDLHSEKYLVLVPLA